MAREWREAIDKGEYESQADLARRKAISRARVTQVLNPLKLDREVQEKAVELGDPMSADSVTQRKLRSLLGLSARQQKQKLKILLSSR